MFYVYRLIDADDLVVYVGTTNNIKRRIADHKSNKPWINEVVRVKGSTFQDKGKAAAEERRLIKKLQPKYNKVLFKSSTDRMVDNFELFVNMSDEEGTG